MASSHNVRYNCCKQITKIAKVELEVNMHHIYLEDQQIALKSYAWILKDAVTSMFHVDGFIMCPSEWFIIYINEYMLYVSRKLLSQNNTIISQRSDKRKVLTIFVY